MTADKRPSWDDVWLQVALTIAQRSQCDRAQVGAVIVTSDNKVDSCSYNGPVAALELTGTCTEWCPRAQSGETTSDYGRCSTIHAEANALIRSDHNRIKGGTIYVSRAMCVNCAKEVANSGVSRVVQYVTELDLHRNPREVVVFLRKAKLRVTTVGRCTKCHLTWKSSGAMGLVESHDCVGTPTPTIDDLLLYMGAVKDERGCLIPTRGVGGIGYQRRYRGFSKSVTRVLGDVYAHRVILALKLGRPLVHEASHICGDDYENSACVNPDHLAEQTHRENHARMPRESRRRASSAGGKASPAKFVSGHVPWNKGRRGADN